MNVIRIFLYLVWPCIVLAFPSGDSTTESLLAVGKQTADGENESDVDTTKNESLPPQLKSMNVTSHVRNRYARTVVVTRYANPSSSAKEATFSIVLPSTAFITGFIMEIKGKEYKAYVREKEEAKQEYDEAVRRGQAAAHVAASVRDSNRFTVSMNVEGHDKVIFTLTYEELLVRKQGLYDLAINLHPGQIVKDLSVDVYIDETKPIVSLQTPALRSGNKLQDPKDIKKNPFATSEMLNEEGTKAHIHFAPTKTQQMQMATELNPQDDKNGLTGQFSVQYDVERDPQGGEVIVSNGYFVHFFAPSELKPLPKHVVFVLDVSGSMAGRKLDQLKQAMLSILDELSPEDFFDIIKFSSSVQVLTSEDTWQEVEHPSDFGRPDAHPATAENVLKVKKVITDLSDEGITNIYDALQVAVKLSQSTGSTAANSNDKINPQPLIIFLTDGQANVAETRSEKIIEMVTSRNKKAALFTLGFGSYVDETLLKGLAKRNHGFMRKIYEASDAALQLENFYREISSPLLTDVAFKFTDEKVENVTRPVSPIMFRGSEMVLAGKIKTTDNDIIEVEGKTREGPKIFRPSIRPLPVIATEKEYGSLERLWAYLTIKQLLEKKFEEPTEFGENKLSPEKQALKLALQYSFVTPVTSLVVVKPNATQAVNEEKADDRILEHSVGIMPLSISAHRPIRPAGYSGFAPLIIGGAPFSGDTNRFALTGGPPAASSPVLIGPHVQHSLIRPVVPMQTIPDTFYDQDFSVAVEDLVSKTIVDYLPWMAPYYSNNEITIDNKTYMLGNNQTIVESKQCSVESVGSTGSCTLLSACPAVYPKLDSFDTYKKYFCSLNDKYAGVCCIP